MSSENCYETGLARQTQPFRNTVNRGKMKYSGKEEKINGLWYSVIVIADSYKDAIRKLYVGQKKSYGIVEEIRGRFSKGE